MEGAGEGRGRRGSAWAIKKNEKYIQFSYSWVSEGEDEMMAAALLLQGEEGRCSLAVQNDHQR